MKRTITVKGIGTVASKPDFIAIQLRIVSKDMEYPEAVEGANKRISELQRAIVSAGFQKEDLKTLSFNVQTSYENVQDDNGRYRREFAGYQCEYRLKLSFDLNSAKLANTLNAIANSGADAEISIAFTVKNPEKVSAALLKSAAENALQKALVLCAAFDAKLGDLLTIDYDWTDISFMSASTYSANELMRGVAVASVPEFEPEDIRTHDSATFVWEIE